MKDACLPLALTWWFILYFLKVILFYVSADRWFKVAGLLVQGEKHLVSIPVLQEDKVNWAQDQG